MVRVLRKENGRELLIELMDLEHSRKFRADLDAAELFTLRRSFSCWALEFGGYSGVRKHPLWLSFYKRRRLAPCLWLCSFLFESRDNLSLSFFVTLLGWYPD